MVSDGLAKPIGRATVARGSLSRAMNRSTKAEIWGWSLLAGLSLAIAGILALLVALSRTPGVQDFLPQDFFRTALVTHVVFSVVVWYLALLGLLCCISSARLTEGAPRLAILGPVGLVLVALGSLVLFVVTIVDAGEPSLHNYIPTLLHPAYYWGLGAIALGVALPVVRQLFQPGVMGEPATFAVTVAGLAYLVALFCFALAWRMLPAGLDPATWNERLFWGGGHVLQFTHTALMLAAWHMLSAMSFGAPPLPDRAFKAAVAAMLPFILVAPAFYGLDPLGLDHRDGFTALFRYGLILPPLAVAGGFAWTWYSRERPAGWRSPVFLALVLSVALFGLGGIEGYFLGVADTRTPGHYHAVIGGVSLAFWGLLLGIVLPALGRSVSLSVWETALFWLYGAGQALHSIGLFAAGTAGVPRKTAGAGQGLDTLPKIIAMATTGIGAIVAVLGGILFIVILLRRLAAAGSAIADEARGGP